ncbi:rhodanese-like domain-containing protein [Allochromatium humboldtianum]|nr:rhodanese-like domain-containing protein [Allochromatium humboldtianum]
MNDPLDDLAAGIDPARMGQAKISIDAFIAAHNQGEAELIDIRVAEETAVWQVNIGLRIPGPELPARLDELPKDKLLVVACPHTDRSNMARSYLVARGFNAKYLQGGLLGLVDRLKGVGAQDICLDR